MKSLLKIIDAHVHFYHHPENQHTFLDEANPAFEEFVGDYSTLPRQYLLENYLQDNPASVTLYLCERLLGLSGSVISSHPLFKAGLSIVLRNLSREPRFKNFIISVTERDVWQKSRIFFSSSDTP